MDAQTKQAIDIGYAIEDWKKQHGKAAVMNMQDLSDFLDSIPAEDQTAKDLQQWSEVSLTAKATLNSLMFLAPPNLQFQGLPAGDSQIAALFRNADDANRNWQFAEDVTNDVILGVVKGHFSREKVASAQR